jgi:SpoVK/Ycf46/Vps4 family AAA+-type ATPase
MDKKKRKRKSKKISMFDRLKKQSTGDLSKQELKPRIQELKTEASRLSSESDPDPEILAKCFKELERCFRALADKESFPPLEEKYRSKAANWRKAADQKRVVDTSSITPEVEHEREGQESDQEDTTEEFDWEDPEIDFSDVGGRDELKSRLWELAIDPVENKEQHRTYRVPVPNGILFAGPPGTGKSHMAKALAGELDRKCLNISLAEIRDSLAGESEKNVTRLFEQAKEHQPCLIIIDEVDALIQQRGSDDLSAGMRQLVSQFLRDMPSLKQDDVLIVGTTNFQGDMDDAVDRPGRFGQDFTIGLPDRACRQEVLQIQLEDRPVVSCDVDLRQIARLTQDYSCADLEEVAVEAARQALKEDTSITQKHLERGVQQVDPSVNPSKW